MTVETHTCNGRPDPAVTRARREERDEIRARVLAAVYAGPGTASEIRDRMGTYSWFGVVYYGTECRGHLSSSEPYETPFPQSRVQQELKRLERLGLTCRVVVAGWQAHLWAVTP